MAGEHGLAAVSSGALDWSSPTPAEPESMKRATYEDVLNAPENKVAEILDGELILSPRPAPRHAVASSALVGTLHGPFDGARGGPGGWWILGEPELHLGDAIAVPDLAGWRRGRMPSIPEEAFFSLAPDWVCEVLSPSTERIDRSRKRIYAEAESSPARRSHRADSEVLRLRMGHDDRRGVRRLGRRAHTSLRSDPD
jgi:Uma2 family endonuclease